MRVQKKSKHKNKLISMLILYVKHYTQRLYVCVRVCV